MTTAEVKKLFDLLRDLHGKDKPRDERTTAIWAAVLEPWSYKQVRAAALERARENRYYPDPAELTEYLPQIPRKTAAGATRPQVTGASDAVAKAKQEAAYAAWFAAREKLSAKRRAAEIPATLADAETAGMTPTEWWKKLEMAGLQVEASVFACGN